MWMCGSRRCGPVGRKGELQARKDAPYARRTAGTPEPLFRDALFRQKRKHGKFREVDAPRLEAPVADTHAHLQLLPDPALALARCAAHRGGVRVHHRGRVRGRRGHVRAPDAWRAKAAALAPGSGAPCESRRPRGAARAHRHGCHPHNAKHYDDALEARLRERLADPRVCAVGEVGLDYHYDFSPRDAQRDAFRRQVRVAKEAGLPVILHVREAHDEAFSLMQEEGFPEAGTLLHCYNLDWATLEPWLEAGCHVAFGGPLTFKKADEVRDAAARVPAGAPAHRNRRALHDARAHARHDVRPRTRAVHGRTAGAGARVRAGARSARPSCSSSWRTRASLLDRGPDAAWQTRKAAGASSAVMADGVLKRAGVNR